MSELHKMRIKSTFMMMPLMMSTSETLVIDVDKFERALWSCVHGNKEYNDNEL